ncbi:AMP-binding enzyme C-terminal domain [Phytophthora cactorum]|nr:AMP-binding enzyme C-terminal domain [Phytophthora cactorum]
MFESTPMYPHHGRYWDLVQRHKVTKFYTAPTAIRALMARGDDKIREYDLSSLKVLGSVGEPINPEAWKWYYEWWATDSATLLTRQLYRGQLCIRSPWPGMARTVYGDHNRYLQVYTASHKGLYFTGDGCRRDKDGYYFITGRIDDVLCTSGHRIGTAELESTLVGHSAVAEAAVIGIPHRIKGEGICCYITLWMELSLLQRLRSSSCSSGKIVRRVLRKISHGEEDSLGDMSTLAEPEVVPVLISAMRSALVGKSL